MTQEEKDLLMTDLCARLPYNVRVEYNGTTFTNIFDVLGIAHGRIALCLPFMSKTECPLIEEVKPYLFPLSSMTEEEMKELLQISNFNPNIDEICYDFISFIERTAIDIVDIVNFISWLNAHHFDYRGLIEKGLAIDATGLNIY